MASPLGIGDIKVLIDQAIAIYRKYKDTHEQMDRMNDEMLDTRPYLERLQIFLTGRSGFEMKVPKATTELLHFLKEIKSVTREVILIFDDWEHSDGFISTFGFAMFSQNPKRLKDYSERLSYLRGRISEWLLFTNTQLQNTHMEISKSNNSILKALQQNPSKVSAPKSCNILFLDAMDTGQGVIANLYAKLLLNWTKRNGGRWPVGFLHSAGVAVQGTGSVKAAQRAVKIETTAGSRRATPLALVSLFNNTAFNFSFKKDVDAKANAHRSKSLPNDYKKYDYVVVFDDDTKRSFDALISHLERGNSGTTWKGKVIRLADYHPKRNIWRIDAPSDGPSDSVMRDQWVKTTALIKEALRGFLTKELGWQQPRD